MYDLSHEVSSGITHCDIMSACGHKVLDFGFSDYGCLILHRGTLQLIREIYKSFDIKYEGNILVLTFDINFMCQD
jgi:hypothetical protein